MPRGQIGGNMLLIKKLRIDRGLSQAAFARKCELCAPTVCNIETGRMRPYRTQIEKIVAALDWQGDPEELVPVLTDRGHKRFLPLPFHFITPWCRIRIHIY